MSEPFVLTYRGHLRDGETTVVRMFPDKHVVVFSEIPGRVGLSVTNGAECIATALVNGHDVNPDWEFVEHYPGEAIGEDVDTFDVVMFHWTGKNGVVASCPAWRRIDAQIVHELTGEDPGGWEVMRG